MTHIGVRWIEFNYIIFSRGLGWFECGWCSPECARLEDKE